MRAVRMGVREQFGFAIARPATQCKIGSDDFGREFHA